MKDLGVYYANQLGFAPGEDPNWTQFGLGNDDVRVGFFLPTPEVPGAAAALLLAAQEASARLPKEDLVEWAYRNLQRQLQSPPEVIGVRHAADGDMLLLNLGVGVMAFQLTDAAKDELAQLCRELS